MKVHLKKIGPCKFDAVNSDGHHAIMDGPPDIGGQDEGVRPMQMVLMGLAGCSAVDVIHIAQKSRQTISDMDVEVEATRTDAIPAVFETIHLHFKVRSSMNEGRLQRAVDLSMEKYCSVAMMLNKTAKITHSCELLPPLGVKKLDWQFITFSGNPESLLKGLTTNTMQAAQTAFCDKNGKIIATCAQTQFSDDSIGLAVPNIQVPGLMAHLYRYLKLSKVEMVQTDRAVYHDLEGSVEVPDGAHEIPAAAGKLIVASDVLDASCSDEAYQQFRLDNALPEAGTDFKGDMLLNVYPEGWVDYDKGCFVGQEVIARVHHKSKPPKRLEVVDASSTQSPDTWTSVEADNQGEPQRGFAFVSSKLGG